jgi:hypothetical protein
MAKSVAAARIGSFHFMAARVILAKCLGTAYPRATALHSANCRPIFMSCRVRGRALAARSNMTLRPGASSTIGPRAFRSRTPKSTFLKRGSVIFSTTYLGRADEVGRDLR